MGLDVTKPVFPVSGTARLKPVSQLQRLENWNFDCSKFRYDTFQKVNKKGADQSAWMRRLVCTFVHTGQCKRTGGCYNELVVAFLAPVVA